MPPPTGNLVLRNTSWLVGQPLALNAISLFSTGYIARRLGAEGFATFNIGLAFATLFSPLTNMGLRALTVRHVAQHRGDADDYVGTVLALRMLLGALTVALVIMVLPWVSDSADTRRVALISTAVIVINTPVGVYTDALHAFEEMGHAARAMMWGGLVLTAASVIAVAAGGGPEALAVSYLTGPIVTAVMLSRGVTRIGIRPRLHWNFRRFRELLGESLPFFGQGLFDSLSGRLDLFVLTRTIGEAGLGGYAAAGQLASRASVVVEGASSALLPSLARIRASDPAQADQLLRTTLRGLMALLLPMAVCVGISAPQVMHIVFGPGYSDGAIVLALAMLTMPLTAVAMALGHSLFVIHRNRLVIQSSVVSTGTTSALVVPGALFLGILGAPIARVIGRILLIAQRLPESLANYPQLWKSSDTLRIAAVTLVTAVPFLVLRLGDFGTVGFFVTCLVATPVYIGSLLFARLIPDQVLDPIRQWWIAR